jgi:hypothetical protein
MPCVSSTGPGSSSSLELGGRSVGEPDPQDPHVFGPPGSGSLVRGTDPDPDPSLLS